MNEVTARHRTAARKALLPDSSDVRIEGYPHVERAVAQAIADSERESLLAALKAVELWETGSVTSDAKSAAEVLRRELNRMDVS